MYCCVCVTIVQITKKVIKVAKPENKGTVEGLINWWTGKKELNLRSEILKAVLCQCKFSADNKKCSLKNKETKLVTDRNEVNNRHTQGSKPNIWNT